MRVRNIDALIKLKAGGSIPQQDPFTCLLADTIDYAVARGPAGDANVMDMLAGRLSPFNMQRPGN